MSTRQLEASEFAAHWLEQVAAFKKDDTVVELTHGGKIIATIVPAHDAEDSGTLADWMGSGAGTVSFAPSYDPHAPSFEPADLRQKDGDLLELACHAYAAGRVSREAAANLASLTRAEFDQALFERRIPSYDEARLAEDRQTLRSLRNR